MKYYNEDLVIAIDFYRNVCSEVKNFGKENLSSYNEIMVMKEVTRLSDSNSILVCDIDMEYKDFLKEYNRNVAEYNTLVEQCVESNRVIGKKIGEDFNSLLSFFNQRSEFFGVEAKDNQVEIVLTHNSAFSKKLVLKDACISGDTNGTGFYSPLWLELSECEDEGRYAMELVYERLWGEYVYMKIVFGSYETSAQVYNAMNTASYRTPWNYLQEISEALLVKAHYAPELINEKEDRLLDLAEALINIPQKYDKKAENDYDYEKQSELGIAASTLFFYDDITKLTEKKKLSIRALCDKKHEALWRVIYNEFALSQEGYPNSSELACEKEELEAKRCKVACILKGAGFKGTYPDFYKDGEIKAPKVIYSYSKYHMVAPEKNCRYHVKCIEQDEKIEFICGYVCAGKEPVTYNDAFAASFFDKGKRYFRSLNFYQYEEDWYNVELSPCIEVCATVAAKKAQAEILNDEEKENFDEKDLDFKERLSFMGYAMLLCAIVFPLSVFVGGFAVELIFEGSFMTALYHVLEDFDFPSILAISVVFGVVIGAIEIYRSGKKE